MNFGGFLPFIALSPPKGAIGRLNTDFVFRYFHSFHSFHSHIDSNFVFDFHFFAVGHSIASSDIH